MEENKKMTEIESSIRRVQWKCRLLRLLRSYNNNDEQGPVWWCFENSKLIDGDTIATVRVAEGETLFEDSSPFYSIQGRCVSDRDILKAFDTCSVEKQAQILDICKRKKCSVHQEIDSNISSTLPLCLIKRLLSLHKMASIYDSSTNQTFLFPSLAMVSSSSSQHPSASYAFISRRIIIKSTRPLRCGDSIFLRI